MKFALVNPDWNFEGSIYFGCREPHLPLELGYAQKILEEKGHEAVLIDAHLEGLGREEVRQRVASCRPDFTVLTTAPTYLFWRCPPPEMRIPMQLCAELRPVGGVLIAVGPHGSVTPGRTLQKLEADLVIRGEFEQVLPKLAGGCRSDWDGVCALAYDVGGRLHITGPAHEADMTTLPILEWPAEMIRRHQHHHHRFDSVPVPGPGAEVEASRGCPFRCSFCARQDFRSRYRKRPTERVIQEIELLVSQHVSYIYFIDEIFFPDEELLRELARLPVRFGIQTRIDLWSPERLKLLGDAGCASIEAGLESITAAGRMSFGKVDLIPEDEVIERLGCAKRHVPFVQATLMDATGDDPRVVETWREALQNKGIWVNRPVPLFPYPGSGEYEKCWGSPDDEAWGEGPRTLPRR